MDYLQRFLDFLTNQKIPAASATVKNYKADIRKFIDWYEKEFKNSFDPQNITLALLDLYKKEKTSSPLPHEKLSSRTLERHMSSLRKFFSFLKDTNSIEKNPFLEITEDLKKSFDPWQMKNFRGFLYANQSSKLTIKNYILDVHQFLKWAEEVTKPINNWDLSNSSIFEKISKNLVEEYKNRLQNTAKFSPASINRKLSAIRKYIAFAKQQSLIPLEKTVSISNLPARNAFASSACVAGGPDYSRFPPVRLFQKITQGVSFAVDWALILPLAELNQWIAYKLWQLKGSPLFMKRERFILPKTKLLYTPLYASSLSKTMWYRLRYSRPKWYYKYHANPVTTYFHFAILCICILLLLFGFYTDFLTLPEKGKSAVAAQVSPPRVLSFHGRLTDAADTPITSAKSIKFSLYDDLQASGSAFLWQETNSITPDKDGTFYTLLGKNTPISQSVFSQHSTLFLGIAVGNDSELTPRQQLATVAYAANAEVLQGLAPITQTGAGEKNVILALDSSGNLTIGGIASPVFQATGGSLKLSGQQLLLASNPGSNGNVEIAPDGNGKIDVQKPLVNTTNNGLLLPGAVEVHDQFAIMATSSGKAAFILNNNTTTGDIFTASSSGITRFIVDNGGKVGIGGIIKPNAALQVAGEIAPAADGDASIGKSDLAWGNVYAKNITLPSTGGTDGYWKLASGILSPTNLTNDFAVGGATSSSAKLRITAGNGNIITSGTINSAFDSSSYTERLCWSGSGTSLISDCSGSPGDYAEQYGTSDPSIEAGDVVAIDPTRNAVPFEKNGEKSSKAWILKSGKAYDSSVIGIVSTHANEVIGKVFDKSENPRPVALNGRVPVKVTVENGVINKGDYLTSSKTPGVAMKATSAGPVIGKALQDFSSDGIGLITAFVNNSWYDPAAYITDAGDLSIISNSPNSNKNFAFVIASETKPRQGGAAVAESDLAMTKSAKLSGEIIRRVGVYSELFAANLTTGFIKAQEISSQALIATTARLDQITSNEIISPIVDASLLKTDTISPLSSDTIVLNGKIVIAKKSPVIASEAPPRRGEAISDEVLLEVQGSASISGILSASDINASTSSFLNSTIGNLTSDQAAISSFSGQLAQFDNVSANFARLDSLEARLGTFTQGLVTLGGASFTDVSVSSSLAIHRTLILANNSINVLGADLELQPFRQGGISMLSGLIHIDTDGNLKAQGADFAKNVNVMGNFAANIISPLPDKDVIIRLGNVILEGVPPSAGRPIGSFDDSIASLQNDNKSFQNYKDGKFVIQNANGSSVLEINSSGNLIASGAGMFKDLIGKGLSIVREAQADTSLTETVASGSAGFAAIIQGETERTIINPYVKDTSLIYITPTSDTQGATPYIARQTPGSFVIQIPQAVYKDIKLNWWIVN